MKIVVHNNTTGCVQIEKRRLFSTSNFGNSKSDFFKNYLPHLPLKNYVKNLSHTITSAYPEEKTTLSFIYIKITSTQGKIM